MKRTPCFKTLRRPNQPIRLNPNIFRTTYNTKSVTCFNRFVSYKEARSLSATRQLIQKRITLSSTRQLSRKMVKNIFRCLYASITVYLSKKCGKKYRRKESQKLLRLRYQKFLQNKKMFPEFKTRLRYLTRWDWAFTSHFCRALKAKPQFSQDSP